MNILFASSEAVPFAKTGGLGDVMGSLPGELNQLGADARVVMPLYKNIRENFASSLTFIKSFSVWLSWRECHCGLFQIKYKNVIYYFLDNERYFDRDWCYGYFDDGERFSFFCKAVLATVREGEFKPDIIHCNEWQTALIPVYKKTLFADDVFYKDIPTVFTIHNIEYQGQYSNEILTDLLGLSENHRGILEMRGQLNFMKGAIVTCDHLTTVSPTYAEEIMHGFYARGLEDILRENSYKLTGILNGIDEKLYNPATDKELDVTYSADSTEGKGLNKAALQRDLGLEIHPDIPLIAMIGRLAEHKGIDLVMRTFDDIVSGPAQFVLLGTGDKKYEEFFHKKAKEYSGRVSVTTSFSSGLASRIYAGADLFLMPSVSEPCGLAQMIALRYGTIPIVRETGGLKDTITAFDRESGLGNGITFSSINAHDMLYAIRRGHSLFSDKEAWAKLKKNAFASDFSWEASARKYLSIYNKLIDERNSYDA